MIRIITSIGTLAVTTAISLAQDEPRPPERPGIDNRPGGFAQLDKNHDGVLDFREFASRFEGREARAKAEVLFKRLDKNGDRKLSPDEFKGPQGEQPGVKPPPPNPADIFAKMDTDGDGSLSLAEFLASPAGQKGLAKAEEFFKRMDKDGDGSVTLDEFRAAHHSDRPEKPKPPLPADAFKRFDTNQDGVLNLDEILATEMGRNNPDKAREYFKRMDRDGDGEVTADEFRAFHQAQQPSLEDIFHRMDTNNDGYISLDEFRAAHQGRKGPGEPNQPVPNDGAGTAPEPVVE